MDNTHFAVNFLFSFPAAGCHRAWCGAELQPAMASDASLAEGGFCVGCSPWSGLPYHWGRLVRVTSVRMWSVIRSSLLQGQVGEGGLCVDVVRGPVFLTAGADW